MGPWKTALPRITATTPKNTLMRSVRVLLPFGQKYGRTSFNVRRERFVDFLKTDSL